MTDKDPNSFTVKEILTEIVIPQLKALDEKVDAQQESTDSRFHTLEAAKNRMTGALILIGAVLVPLSVPVVTAVAEHKI